MVKHNNIIWVVAMLTGASFLNVKAQTCNINVTTAQNPVCKGSDVIVTATGAIQNAGSYNFDFNGGGLPPGWGTTGSSFFNSPCLPSPDGTPYYWAGSAGTLTPQLETADLDVSGGGTIDFEFVMEQQGGAQPCEGPDLSTEGFSVQYSTNAGATWVDITYFSPGGFQLPANPGLPATGVANGPTPYTVWNTISIPIPPAAQTPSTRFRWIQIYSSGSCCDNWGLDNIVINAGSLSNMSWSTGLTGTPGQAGSDTLFALQNDSCVIVTIADTSGLTCTDTLCIQVVDLPTALANFQNPSCAGDAVTIQGSISTPVGSVVNWEYDFDDNGTFETTSTTGDVPFPNPIPGVYNVPMRITNSGGCEHDTVLVLTRNPRPNINLNASPLNICQGEPLDLIATTGINNPPGFNTTVDSLVWDFTNDGSIDSNTLIIDTLNYSFSVSGAITVKVTAISSEGCRRDDSIEVTVRPGPTADFSVQDVCIGDPLQLTNNSVIDSAGTIALALWTSNGPSGNQSGTGTSPDFSYDVSGQHTMFLYLESSTGCADSIEVPFEVYPELQADFQSTPICFNEVLFADASFGGEGDYNYTWTMVGSDNQDTVYTNTDSFLHVFPSEKDTLVTLLVEDANGCRSDTTKLVNVVGQIPLPDMPNALVINPQFDGNDKLDFTTFAPGFNQCYDYELTIYNRWGVSVYVAENVASAPDMDCSDCFKGLTEGDTPLAKGTYYWTLTGNRGLEANGTLTIFER